jgi:hypothetical protein
VNKPVTTTVRLGTLERVGTPQSYWLVIVAPSHFTREGTASVDKWIDVESDTKSSSGLVHWLAVTEKEKVWG